MLSALSVTLADFLMGMQGLVQVSEVRVFGADVLNCIPVTRLYPLYLSQRFLVFAPLCC